MRGVRSARLKYQDAARVGTRDHFAVDTDRAARRRQESGHRVQQRRFSTTGWAYQANKLTVVDIEVDVFEHGQGFAIAVVDHA
jgi:hypothetical protein